jgi:hypothetical protein
MMNKSLRARARESSRKADYGFQRGEEDVGNKTYKKGAAVSGGIAKKEPPFPAALKLITGRRQTE